MRNILFLTVLFVWSSCKKDFPEPTDPYNLIALDVSENWRYDYPEGQHICWVNATENDVIYVTQSIENLEMLYFYHFSLSGALLNTFEIQAPFLNSNLGYKSFVRVENWVFAKSFMQNYFINLTTGKVIYSQQSWDLADKKPFDMLLSKKSTVIYQQYRDKYFNEIYYWNLDTDEKQLVDTINTFSSKPKEYKIIGELFRNINIAQHGRFRPTFLVSYSGASTYEYDLFGLFFDTKPNFHSRNWSSDNVFRSNNRITSADSKITKTDIFIPLNHEIYCLDAKTQTLKWKRLYPKDVWVSDVTVNISKAFFRTAYKIQAVDLSSGSNLWSVATDRYSRPFLATEDYLIVVNFRKMNQETLLSDEINHIDIYDLHQGRLLHSAANILNSKNLKVNDPLFALGYEISAIGNTLYLADHQYFGAVTISQK